MNTDNYNQLQLDIQKKVGYQIENLSELKMLHEDIEWNTNKKIGFNTLRRFFGFLKSTAPNLNTLNTLSQYIGYENYSTYQKNSLRDNDWFVWTQTIKIELSDSLNESDIQWLEMQQKTSDYHLKIASIIKTFIYRKNYIILNQFFDNRILKFEETNQLKLAANICLLFRSLSEDEIETLIQKITPNKVFRENILHWFVDYSNFNNYYGAFILEARKHALPESHESLFYDLILNYNKYLSCSENLKKIDVNRIKPDFFIVLKGRCYGYNLLYLYEQKSKSEYEKTWAKFLILLNKSEQINLLTIEIFPVLLFIKDFEKTTYLIQNYYEELLTLENWSGYPNLGMILITQTLHLIKENKIKEAKIGFELINLSKFSLAYSDYIKLFYLIAKYQLELVSSSNTIKLIEIQTEYQSIVNRTGFKRFSVDLMKQYLTNPDLDSDAKHKHL
jgi:hypothetical protein